MDLTGRKFGRLTVIGRANNAKDGKVRWVCVCSCADRTECVVFSSNLIRGHTQSCGCQSRENKQTHGGSNTRLYRIWGAMKQRCYNPTDNHYKDYGGRGIRICDEWLRSFEAFYGWSIANGYDETAPRGQCTLDRIDNDGSYAPQNCRWTTQREQTSNTRRNKFITYNGKTQTEKQWAIDCGIPYSTLKYRLKMGWSMERAATEKAVMGKNQYTNKTD